MKKSIGLFVILFICCFTGIVKEVSAEDRTKKQEIKMQFFNVPPHIFMDDKTGEIKGAVYSFVNEHIGPEMGVKFTWHSGSNVPRQIHTLQTKPGYAAALLIYSKERSKVADFTKTPYHMNQSALIVHRNNPIKKILTIEDILSLKIGYAKGTFLTPFMRDKRIQFDLITSSDFMTANMKKLLANRIDATYAPDKTALLYSIQDHDRKKVKLLDLPEIPAAAHVVFSKGSKEIVEKYNQAFDKLDGQALYSSLLSKFIDSK